MLKEEKYKCSTCREEVEKEIYLKTPYTEGQYFCSIACLLWYLKEMCPRTFDIEPREIAYQINKKVPKLKW